MIAFSQAAENNKVHICDKLSSVLKNASFLLEIGSGSGQHAVHMAQHLSHLTWQPSELAENLNVLNTRLTQEAPENVENALALDVSSQPWPLSSCDAIYSANVVHYMSWTRVEHLFDGVGQILDQGGILCLYGPYKYNGNFTTESNARFDQWLKQGDAQRGVRDFEEVDRLANKQGLSLKHDFAMPANNQLLVWQR